MDGVVVLVVEFVFFRDSLFVDEDDAAEVAAGGDVAGGFDGEGHAK